MGPFIYLVSQFRLVGLHKFIGLICRGLNAEILIYISVLHDKAVILVMTKQSDGLSINTDPWAR